ncbi:UBX domain-containing protein 8 isoform X3 [Dasypus novemcinctus]|uniref:UBX domain-containing protein 8 isoform X3 n=1 Tax=Dasypus novemcinctus TaxID=9361 RepID=UPI00265DA5BF|nr:UBX domain-containing protein 8 isoform X3 [Dasypus novemcinctus]
MASRGVLGVFLLSVLPLLCLELRRGSPDLGIKDFILLCGRIFLLLALLTLIISVTTSWVNSFKSSEVYLKEEEEEEKNEKMQKLVRNKQQEAQSEQAIRYIENVLKPHQEMRLKKLEERFYRMSGETWKLSNGHKLGVLELPEEPPKTADEVVTVALRCPSGSVLKRRFFKTCSSQPTSPRTRQEPSLDFDCSPWLQPPCRTWTCASRSCVLLDWMMKIGYHTSLYSLSTSFPRRPLEVEGSWSLEDVGITVDTVLTVEEK